MEKEIIAIIARILEVDVEEVELDTAVGDLPEWDSLHHLQIIAELEKTYSIKFSQDDLAELIEGKKDSHNLQTEVHIIHICSQSNNKYGNKLKSIPISLLW